MESYDQDSADEFNFKFKRAKPYIGTQGKRDTHYKFEGKNDPAKLTKDSFFKIPYGFSARKNNIFYNILQKNIQKLFESGITNKVPGKSFNDYSNFKSRIKKLEYNVERGDWTPLTMDHLRAGFVIWIVTVSISIIVFIFEIIHHMTKKRTARRKRKFFKKKKNKKT